METRGTALTVLVSLAVLASCSGDDLPPAAVPSATPSSSATRTIAAPTPTAPASASPTSTSSASPTIPPPSPTPVSDQSMTPTATSSHTPCPLTPTGTKPPPGSPTPTFFGPTPHFVTHFEPTPPETVTDYWPRFSPQGDTILFTRSLSGEEKSFLATVPSSGGEVQEFPPPGPTRTPLPVSATRSSWSWNTSLTEHQIAFSGASASGAETYLISEDGSGLEKIAPDGVGAVVDYPSWYPDGAHLAVVDYGSVPGAAAGTLRVFDTTVQTQEPLTDVSQIYAGEPAVSRDGTRIAFPGQINCSYPYNQDDNQIYLLDLATGGVSLFDPQQGRTPDWSPDDAFLAYETTRYCPDGRYAIIIQNVANRTAIQATACAYDANHPVWSPDAATIAFSAVIPGTENRGIATIPAPDLSAVRGYTISGVLHSFGCEGLAMSGLSVDLSRIEPFFYGRHTLTEEGAFAFENVPPGTYDVLFQNDCGNFPCYSPRQVQVSDSDVSLDVCYELCPAPLLDPPSGPPGTTVQVFGRCYFIHSGAHADLLFDGAAVGAGAIGDTIGNYSGSFQVPLDAASGAHTVALAAAAESTAPFEVTE